MINDELEQKIINWNVNFPLDRIWRKKYNIPFNSSAHREVSFFDQLMDIEEDRFFEELYSKEDYAPNIGEWLKTPKVSEENMAEDISRFREEFKDLNDDEY